MSSGRSSPSESSVTVESTRIVDDDESQVAPLLGGYDFKDARSQTKERLHVA